MMQDSMARTGHVSYEHRPASGLHHSQSHQGPPASSLFSQSELAAFEGFLERQLHQPPTTSTLSYQYSAARDGARPDPYTSTASLVNDDKLHSSHYHQQWQQQQNQAQQAELQQASKYVLGSYQRPSTAETAVVNAGANAAAADTSAPATSSIPSSVSPPVHGQNTIPSEPEKVANGIFPEHPALGVRSLKLRSHSPIANETADEKTKRLEAQAKDLADWLQARGFSAPAPGPPPSLPTFSSQRQQHYETVSHTDYLRHPHSVHDPYAWPAPHQPHEYERLVMADVEKRPHTSISSAPHSHLQHSHPSQPQAKRSKSANSYPPDSAYHQFEPREFIATSTHRADPYSHPNSSENGVQAFDLPSKPVVESPVKTEGGGLDDGLASSPSDTSIGASNGKKRSAGSSNKGVIAEKKAPAAKIGRRALSGSKGAKPASISKPGDVEMAGSGQLEEKPQKPSTKAASGSKQKDGASQPKEIKAALTEEQKRANHILSEQKRRNAIRLAYDDLCSIVPALKAAIKEYEERLSKVHNLNGTGTPAPSSSAPASKGASPRGDNREDGMSVDGPSTPVPSGTVAGVLTGGIEVGGEKIDGRAGPKSEAVVLAKSECWQ